MKTGLKTVTVIPHGRLSNVLRPVASDFAPRLRVAKTLRQLKPHNSWQFFLTFSHELDANFVQTFREWATASTRLLVLNDSWSSDRLLSSIVDLQIRSPERFYIADPPFEKRDIGQWQELIRLFLGRLTAFAGSESDGRILDGRLDDETLHVVSTEFQRIEIPISKIPRLAHVDRKTVGHFEIDDDGSYIYWPDLDLHLGWEQLLQIVDPEAARKAMQKSREFNKRYGGAIRRIREGQGLAMAEIPGLSDKQVRRIERGECRLTSNATKKLAKAHGITANGYLQKLADALSD